MKRSMLSKLLTCFVLFILLISASTCMELTMLRRQFFNLYPSSYNLHHKLLAKYNRFCVSSDCFQDSKVDGAANNADILYSNFESSINICKLNKLKMKSNSVPILTSKLHSKFRYISSEVAAKLNSTLPYITSGTKSLLKGLRDNWLILGEIFVIAVK